MTRLTESPSFPSASVRCEDFFRTSIKSNDKIGQLNFISNNLTTFLLIDDQDQIDDRLRPRLKFQEIEIDF